jgi:hypothetical protein
MYSSVSAFIADAQHNRLLAVPAALYAVNNYLKVGADVVARSGCVCVGGGALTWRHAMGGKRVCTQRHALGMGRGERGGALWWGQTSRAGWV